MRGKESSTASAQGVTQASVWNPLLKFWKSIARETPLAETRKIGSTPTSEVHHIELNLRNINQLFNTMDHSPFYQRDLDHDAEEFILGWAQEYPRTEPIDLIVHLETSPSGDDPPSSVENAVRNYFAYRARLNRLEFRRLMKQGRISLLVGLAFLGLCIASIRLFALHRAGTLPGLLAQSLTIAGWVAMSRPLEIYLYGWWPLWRRGRIFEKLSRISVEVRKSF